MTDTHAPPWLDTADRIGRRLLRDAEWHGNMCSWNIRVPERIIGVRRSLRAPAPGGLYQGTAGIALFLAELYRQTRDQATLDTALGALRHSLSTVPTMPAGKLSFHGGRVGVAYVAYRLALTARQEELLRTASDVLTPLVDQRHGSSGNDVIGGAAGAIPILLQMREHLPARVTRDVAVTLGDHLIQIARRRRNGWSWGDGIATVADLTGYAHGASGYGHALVELYGATGDEWYRYAAEQAFAYERDVFDAERMNWPDYRYSELSEYMAVGQIDELRERMSSADPLPPYARHTVSAWCHGAPGIGLARIRAYEVLGDAIHRDEAEIAAHTTVRSVRNDEMGYSLCHGHFGNCELLLVAGSTLGEEAFRATAEARALTGRYRFELQGKAWPCGTVGGAADPSLLLGEAGIGYFYLRLHDATTPSILCPGTLVRGPEHVAPTRSAADLRHEHITAFFGTTIAAFDKLGSLAAADAIGASSLREAGVVETHERLVAHIRDEPAPVRKAELIDAFRVERARYDCAEDTDDGSRALLEQTLRRPPGEVDWPSAIFITDDRVELVRTQRNWTAWVRDPSSRWDGETITAVFRSNREVRSIVVTAFTALVLECARETGTASEIAERVTQRVEGVDRARLASAVRAQLETAYAAGILRAVEPSVRVQADALQPA